MMSDDNLIVLPPPAEFGPAQCRAGRAWINWTQRDLAHRAHVGTTTVINFEKGRLVFAGQWSRLRLAFEEAGIVFTPQGIMSRFPDPKDRPSCQIKSDRVVPQSTLDIATMNAIVAAYRSGKTLQTIAEEMKVSRERIRQRLVQYEQLTGETIPRHSAHHRHVEPAAEAAE